MIGPLAVAASEPDLLAEAVAACGADLLVTPPRCGRDLAGVAGAALADALTAVAPRHRATVPIVLAVSGPTIAAASGFAARCLDTSRRLRPSESVRMEMAELVRAFGVATGWRGPCYLLATVGVDGRQAVLAAAALRRRHPAVLVGELLADAVPTGGAAGRDGAVPGILAVVAPVAAELSELTSSEVDDCTPRPADRPAGSVLLALAARPLAVRG